MTDGDDGMPEAGTAGDPAALTRQTAPSPLTGAPGRAWPRPERTGCRTQDRGHGGGARAWRRPRPVTSTRSWPAPVTLTDARADSPSLTLTRDAPRPLSNGRPSVAGYCRPAWTSLSVRAGYGHFQLAHRRIRHRLRRRRDPVHERGSARRSWGCSRVLASAARAGWFRSGQPGA